MWRCWVRSLVYAHIICKNIMGIRVHSINTIEMQQEETLQNEYMTGGNELCQQLRKYLNVEKEFCT